MASSIPQKAENIKIVIFRLDYQTFDLKRSYYFSYPNYIYSYLESDIVETYLFNWDEIPGNDSDRLIEFLEKQYGIGLPKFGKSANIEKIENNRAIRVITGVNTVILRRKLCRWLKSIQPIFAI